VTRPIDRARALAERVTSSDDRYVPLMQALALVAIAEELHKLNDQLLGVVVGDDSVAIRSADR
jgi:hypothetical protein